MKKLSKCIAVFLSFTLLFSSFAFTSSAAESDIQADFDNEKLILTTYFMYQKQNLYYNLSAFHELMNGTSNYQLFTYNFSRFDSINPERKFAHAFEISYHDGRVLMPEGNNFKFAIHNFYSTFYWGELDENNFDLNRYCWLDITRYLGYFLYFYDFNGTSFLISKDMYDFVVSQDEAMITIQMKSDMYDFDVYRIKLFVTFDIESFWSDYGGGGWCTSDWPDEYDSFTCEYGYNNLFVELSTEDVATTGLLTSITNKIQNLIDNILALPERIKNAIKTLFDNLTSSISGFFTDLKTKLTNLFKGVTDGISNLYYSIAGRGEEGDSDYIPSLWQRIIDGIKGLFVPDEEYMSAYSDKWDGLLSQRLGAVYQVSDVLIGSWQNVTDVDTQKTINIPELKIPLPDNNEFIFGPYDVDIIPDGFDFLFSSIRLITSICIVVLVFNGLRRKYEEVVNR